MNPTCSKCQTNESVRYNTGARKYRCDGCGTEFDGLEPTDQSAMATIASSIDSVEHAFLRPPGLGEHRLAAATPQRPSIGRIVLFVSPSLTAHPAVVCGVNPFDPSVVNLRVLWNGPGPVDYLDAVRRGDPHTPGTWHWPPVVR